VETVQPWYTVVIPTRDSAGWIGTVLERYRSRGVIPILLVDTRTKDDTKGVARRHQARVVDMPSFSFTEGVVALTRDIVETPWVLFAHDARPYGATRPTPRWSSSSAITIPRWLSYIFRKRFTASGPSNAGWCSFTAFLTTPIMKSWWARRAMPSMRPRGRGNVCR
jgi:hypothetical protein